MAFVVAPAEIHRDLCTERGAGGCTCAEGASFQPQQAGKEPQEHYVLLDHNGEGTTHEPGLTPQHIRELLRTKTCHCPRKRRKPSSGSDTAVTPPGLVQDCCQDTEQCLRLLIHVGSKLLLASTWIPSQHRTQAVMISKHRADTPADWLHLTLGKPSPPDWVQQPAALTRVTSIGQHEHQTWVPSSLPERPSRPTLLLHGFVPFVADFAMVTLMLLNAHTAAGAEAPGFVLVWEGGRNIPHTLQEEKEKQDGTILDLVFAQCLVESLLANWTTCSCSQTPAQFLQSPTFRQSLAPPAAPSKASRAPPACTGLGFAMNLPVKQLGRVAPSRQQQGGDAMIRLRCSRETTHIAPANAAANPPAETETPVLRTSSDARHRIAAITSRILTVSDLHPKALRRAVPHEGRTKPEFFLEKRQKYHNDSELEAPVLATSWSRAPQELRKGCRHPASHHRGQQQPCAARPRDAPSQRHRKYDFPTETGSPLWMHKADPRACCKLRGCAAFHPMPPGVGLQHTLQVGTGVLAAPMRGTKGASPQLSRDPAGTLRGRKHCAAMLLCSRDRADPTISYSPL
ncbi:hypothetical protein Anapl_08865 [Anas platyrhynchos]|uniref:Uncharacterized protein n=1 Tax=Anas platyrhynchos TaxID=8839 RepID=R0LMY0_ANAPL|nr:hypothetical protein Anapl_08865 [Anas platyrhynchos]